MEKLSIAANTSSRLDAEEVKPTVYAIGVSTFLYIVVSHVCATN